MLAEGTIAAVAAAIAAIVGVIGWWLRNRTSPVRQRKQACEAWQRACRERQQCKEALDEELNKYQPDPNRVDELTTALRDAGRRVRDAEEEYLRF